MEEKKRELKQSQESVFEEFGIKNPYTEEIDIAKLKEKETSSQSPSPSYH